MKIYVVDASKEDLAKLEQYCLDNGWGIKVMRRLGRPRVNYPVQKILNAYKPERTVRGIAEETGVNAGAVWRILSNAGILTQNHARRSN